MADLHLIKIKHAFIKNIYKFASQKNKSTCLVESSLEFDACFHFEFSPSIVAFEAQPLGYEYEEDFILHIQKIGNTNAIENQFNNYGFATNQTFLGTVPSLNTLS